MFRRFLLTTFSLLVFSGIFIPSLLLPSLRCCEILEFFFIIFLCLSWCFTGWFFMQVLQSNTGLLSTGRLSEEVEKLNVAYMNANSRTRNGGVADSSSTDGFAADIEAEANSYFHQMFSGQLSVEAIIQMLSRFKESPDKRSVSQILTYVYSCLIVWGCYMICV